MENFPTQARHLGPEEMRSRREFLSGITPFNLLPEAEIETIAANLAENSHSKGSSLFYQESTILAYVLVVRSGCLERIVSRDGSSELRGLLRPGGIYGGISLLFNNGISTSTVRCAEDSDVYELDRENFLRLCVKYPEFARHFSSTIDERRQKSETSAAARAAEAEKEEDLSGSFLWKNAGDIAKAFPSCPAGGSIRRAAELLTASRRSAIIVLDENSDPAGIITDYDLRKKVLVGGRDPDDPAETVMSSPIIQADVDMPVFEAVLTMMRHRVKHLPVFKDGRIRGVVNERDLILARSHSPVFLVHEVRTAGKIEDLKDAYAKLPYVVTNLISSGAKAGYLNSIITAITDAVLTRVIHMALKELGPPPAEFAFLLFGSEGRKEQTLKTDQDNAIVFEDVDEKDLEEVRGYFLELGGKVCDWLDMIGQKHCEFEIMAKNPSWCQPVSRWKAYYRNWIESDDPEKVLKANIFFDFRLGYGSRELVDRLHAALFDKISEWPGFLRHMAKNTLYYRPPLGFFGNFILQEKKGREGLDIKSAMRLVGDFGRIYAMQSGITETNTLKRLQEIYSRNRMDEEELHDLVHAYGFLMHQRLKHQSEAMKNGSEPDNFIHPDSLTTIDQQALKESFKQIRTAHARMRMDFFLHFP